MTPTISRSNVPVMKLCFPRSSPVLACSAQSPPIAQLPHERRLTVYTVAGAARVDEALPPSAGKIRSEEPEAGSGR